MLTEANRIKGRTRDSEASAHGVPVFAIGEQLSRHGYLVFIHCRRPATELLQQIPYDVISRLVRERYSTTEWNRKF